MPVSKTHAVPATAKACTPHYTQHEFPTPADRLHQSGPDSTPWHAGTLSIVIIEDNLN